MASNLMYKLLQRLSRYLAEFGFCFRVGKHWRDKCTLFAETALFHTRRKRSDGIIEATIRLTTLEPHLQLRPYGGDIFILHEVLKDEVYATRPEWLSTDPKVIVDLGANIGLSSLYLADRFPLARLVCLEPHPENAKLLRHNLACLGSRAQIIQAAIADRPGTMQLALADEHYNASLVRDSREHVAVRSITMEDLCAEASLEKIDLLKMDVEGAEHLILQGEPAWLRRVDLLLAELHGPNQDQLVQIIQRAGLNVDLDGSHVIAHRQTRFSSTSRESL